MEVPSEPLPNDCGIREDMVVKEGTEQGRLLEGEEFQRKENDVDVVSENGVADGVSAQPEAEEIRDVNGSVEVGVGEEDVEKPVEGGVGVKTTSDSPPKTEVGVKDDNGVDAEPCVDDKAKDGSEEPGHDENNSDREDRSKRKSRDKDMKRERDRDRNRSRDRHRAKERDQKVDRGRRRGERDRERDRGRDGRRESRGRGRDRGRHKDDRSSHRLKSRSRSRSGSRRGRRRRSRSLSRNHRSRRYSPLKTRSRKRTRRSRSRGRRRTRSASRGSRRARRWSRSASGDYGGYVPRRRQEAAIPGGSSNDAHVHQQGGDNPNQDEAALRQWQEQLRSRQLILQQAVSAQAIGKGREGFSPLPCPTRQVYVGNLVPGLVSEAALRQLFNSALSAVFPESAQPGMEPVVSVSMHSDGRYAFVELRTPEMATAALQLSGQVQLFGQSISVGRPSGYVDPGKAAAAAQAAAAALAAFQSSDIAASNLIARPAPPTPGMGMVQMGMLTGSALAASPASAFICIEGLVALDTLTSDTTYRKVIADLRNECVKHGAVIQLKIPRPADPKMAQALFQTGFYGKAFVQFSDATAATRAREGLNGQPFQGRPVAVMFVSQEVFAAII
ncbi:hypothetical protein BSKO_00394 [Bryopsis sp. KO-2023]|nr:hypothetical protein BSKO_00394 [Bryopsis sp. KO-2023]